MAEQAVISVSNLTKDYGEGRGIFDLSLEVRPGEIYGYVGTNGSGKTTTIRQMMGFIKPDGGTVTVNGMDPWKQAPELMRSVSYVPGEIAFPSFETGTDFFKYQAQLLGVKDFTRMNHLIDVMELDPTANLKRMSKGMKQKTAVVAALMAERNILILDEPSTGLDPLMRDNFLEVMREEKAMGHTVFMSSHIFEEVEDVCDHVGIIRDGKLLDVITVKEFRKSAIRQMKIVFENAESAQSFAQSWEGSEQEDETVTCSVDPDDMNHFFKSLHSLPVKVLHEKHMDLGQYFMELYRKESTNE
ncbi:MAG: ATP-binding cassette domain-containing protein [Oscillospiraceae bacterium]|nr:ATP-binding cassette domain-containing protein [Oscillospiraceae bacterium]